MDSSLLKFNPGLNISQANYLSFSLQRLKANIINLSQVGDNGESLRRARCHYKSVVVIGNNLKHPQQAFSSAFFLTIFYESSFPFLLSSSFHAVVVVGFRVSGSSYKHSRIRYYIPSFPHLVLYLLPLCLLLAVAGTSLRE